MIRRRAAKEITSSSAASTVSASVRVPSIARASATFSRSMASEVLSLLDICLVAIEIS
jgi:hypothetical protein